jgi:sarcosine oxidase subunit gamma
VSKPEPQTRGPATGSPPVAITTQAIDIVQVMARRGGAERTSATLQALLGAPLPPPGKAVLAEAMSAVWIAPACWLVLAPPASGRSLADIMAAAAGAEASIVDQSDGKTCLAITGARARDVLAKVCRLDLHPRVFSPGHAAVTPIAHVNSVIVQSDVTPTFDLIVPSTLAQSFRHALEEAAAEFGVTTG